MKQKKYSVRETSFHCLWYQRKTPQFQFNSSWLSNKTFIFPQISLQNMNNVQLGSHDMLYKDCNCPVSQTLTFHLHLFPLSKTPINSPFYLHKICSCLYFFICVQTGSSVPMIPLSFFITWTHHQLMFNLTCLRSPFLPRCFPLGGPQDILVHRSCFSLGAGLQHFLLNFLNSCWFISPSCRTPYEQQQDSVVSISHSSQFGAIYKTVEGRTLSHHSDH